LSSLLTLGIVNVLYASEDTIRGSTAATMPHPDLAPIGIHAGGYTLFPSLGYSGGYNDNVFATSFDKKSSYVSLISPKFAAYSNWNNHALNFNAYADILENHTFPRQGYNNWDVKIDGKLDIDHDIRLFAGADYGLFHVPRIAPNDIRGLEPTAYNQARFFTQYVQKSGRIKGDIKLNVTRKEFDDVPAIGPDGLFIIDNSDRDRTEYTLSVRGGYQRIGDDEAFSRIRYFQRDYDKVQNATGYDRSSTGLELLIGTSFDYHGLMLGEFAVGYRTQEYQQPLPDISTPVVDAEIQWNITDLTTSSFTLDRSIQETIYPQFSGYIRTSSVLSIDHELRRNLLLTLSYLYAKLDYSGIPPAEQHDKVYDIMAGVTYRMNRNIFYSFQYKHYQRQTNINTTIVDSNRFDYTINLIYFRIQVQY
jgi:hypothetical protein